MRAHGTARVRARWRGRGRLLRSVLGTPRSGPEQLSVRLAGGPGRCRGYLEVSYNGTWGRVCANGTRTGTGTAVCRQLGCGHRGWLSAVPIQQPSLAWLAWVGCEDGARSLWGCPSAPWHLQSCGTGGYAQVECSGQLRLVGGGGRCAGRVEVEHGGEWGSVCVFDFHWDARLAEVVCRLLGCGRVARASPYAPFGQGTGRIWLQPFFCRGGTGTLCWSILGRSEPCRCPCADAVELRLVGGSSPSCAGRLEVRRGRAWVGVCEDQVDMKAAQVVCRELGCGEVLAIPGSARFGRGSGSFWDGDFQCNGTESLLSACARRLPLSQACAGPASVICSAYTGFRLGNSSSGCSGRVEVAVRGTWGSVCASEWDLADAHVLCRHLGCGRASSVPPGGSFGSGEGTLRPDAFGCHGSERHPGECPVAVLGKPPCVPGNAAAVNCAGFVTTLRLVDGQSLCDGRLEEAITSPAWRRVPLEQWKSWDVNVVCSMLGCGQARDVYSALGTAAALSSSPSLVDIRTDEMDGVLDVGSALTGSPEEMDDQLEERGNVSGMGPALNSSVEEMAITCSGGCPEKGQRCGCPKQPPQPIPSRPTGSRQVRLAGSSGRCAGRVEVYSGGSWSSVCQEGWELQDAAVVCRELGCGTALEAPSRARFGAGTGPLWPYVPDCSGSEESLWECGRTERRECGRGGGAGAVCSEQLSVRLAGGPGRCRGYLEVSYNGTWGRVCADGTSTDTGTAVCRQLGCGHRGWFPVGGTGEEAAVLHRGHGGGRERGPRRWRARLSSPRAAGSGQLRLVGGGGRCAGRVEVEHGGEWGSVCLFEHDWEARWAAVVCRLLGCGRVARASPYARFGQGTGRIWLQPFFCLGTENLLEECLHFGWGRHFCGHDRDAGVTCTGEGTRWPCLDRHVVLHGLPAGEQQLGMLRASGGGSEGDVGIRVRQRVGPGRCARPVPPPGLRPRLQRAPGRLLRQRGGDTAAGRLRLPRERAAPGRVPRGRAGEAALCARKRRRRQVLRCARRLCEEP
uniref:SRCR domain-containing protein n=1 Tax=Taeniopygia guttata TaxID=59729 RepID=H0ZBS7_TAEGU